MHPAAHPHPCLSATRENTVQERGISGCVEYGNFLWWRPICPFFFTLCAMTVSRCAIILLVELLQKRYLMPFDWWRNRKNIFRLLLGSKAWTIIRIHSASLRDAPQPLWWIDTLSQYIMPRTRTPSDPLGSSIYLFNLLQIKVLK